MKKLIVMLLVTFSMVTAGAWVIETVDSIGNRGCPSLVFDSLDHPNISYIGVGDLKYSRWDGSAWQIETVDSSIDAVLDTSLALDSSGNPHIAYHVFTTSDGTHSVKYARWDGTTWQIETLSTADYEYFTSLALDSTDRPHIAYLAGSYHSYQLMYATRNDAAWIFEMIDSGGDSTELHSKPSLAVDSMDNPHISYYDHTGDQYDQGYIKHAYWDGSTWHTETVYDIFFSTKTCLALSTSNTPSIIAANFAGSTTYHHVIDGHWCYEYVTMSSGPSLALDSLDSPHITYKSINGGFNLSYAHKIDSFWQIDIIDSLDGEGGQPSLAIDSFDNPCVAYYIGSNNVLKYAYWDPDASPVDSVSLSAEVADEGVLLSWSIIGDTPASVRVLRAVTQNDTLTQNGSVNLSGELAGSATSWLDVSAEAGVEYAYYLEVTELDGTVSRFGPSEVVVPVAVRELALSDPYPNPCSDSLTIHYSLTNNGTISLNIYDVAGRLVETLVSGEQTAGRHSVNWDSSVAATGIYLLRLEAEGNAITKRAVISR